MSLKYTSVAPAPSSFGAGSITFAEDETLGPYISEINLNGRTFDGAPCYLLRAKIYNVAALTTTVYNYTNFSTLTADDNVITATITNLSGTITITVTFAPDSANGRITMECEVTNTSTTHAVYSVEAPRINLLPYGDADDTYLTVPVWAGYVKRAPHEDTTERYVSSPAALQFLSVYDSASKAQLYLAKKDDVGYFTDFHYQGGQHGETEATLIWFEHFPQNNKTAGNDYTMPYEVELKALQGKGDGRTGYHDACLEYETWALEHDVHGDYVRPWIPTRGKWFDASSATFSSRVSGCNLFINIGDPDVSTNTTAPDWAYYELEVTRAKAMFSSPGTDIILNMYYWHGNIFDRQVPQHTPQRAGADAALTAIHALSVNTSLYTLVQYWCPSCTSPYDITAYTDTLLIGTTDVRNYCFQEPSGSLALSAGLGVQNDPAAALDFSFAYSQLVVADLFNRYRTNLTPDPKGWYLDQVGGGTASLLMNYNPTFLTQGNNGLYPAGKKTMIDFLMANGKSVDSAVFFMTESFEEWTMSFELANQASSLSTTFGFGTQACTFKRIYGQFQRSCDLANIIASPSDSSQALFYLQQTMLSWLSGDILGYGAGNASQIPSLDNATLPSSTIYLTFQGFKVMYDAEQKCRPYFRGKLQRPLSSSWELAAIDEKRTIQNYAQAHPIDLAHSVWKDDDGNLGIIAMNTIAAEQTLTLDFDADDYDLVPGEKTLYVNTAASGAGSRTALTTFTNHLLYDVTIPTGSCYLFEIVPT